MDKDNVKPGIFGDILIASDIDGTFLDSNSRVVARNLEAVERFKEGGGRFLFATGRDEHRLGDIVPDFRTIMNSPGIFNNGANVFDPETGVVLHKRCLEQTLALNVMNAIKREFPEVRVRFTCDGEIIWIGEIPEKDYPRGDWYKIVVDGRAADLERVRIFVGGMCGGRYSMTKSCETLLEILVSDATKGTMLAWLKGWYADRGENRFVWAVGDHENDFDMLKKADAAACPSNARPVICEISRKILCTNDEGAIADLIDYIEVQKRLS